MLVNDSILMQLQGFLSILRQCISKTITIACLGGNSCLWLKHLGHTKEKKKLHLDIPEKDKNFMMQIFNIESNICTCASLCQNVNVILCALVFCSMKETVGISTWPESTVCNLWSNEDTQKISTSWQMPKQVHHFWDLMVVMHSFPWQHCQKSNPKVHLFSLFQIVLFWIFFMQLCPERFHWKLHLVGVHAAVRSSWSNLVC